MDLPTGTRVVSHAELGSTNAEAMRLALAGEAGPLWVVAEVQTGGRGRSGRSWVSERGNLHASYLFVTDAPLIAAHQLSLVAGVAVFDAIAEMGLGRGQGLRLKWPNDILIGGAKAGGILVESTANPGAGRLSAVVGIGLNLTSHPDLPERAVTHLGAHHQTVPKPQAMLSSVDRSLAAALVVCNGSRGFGAIREQWLARAGQPGERLSVEGTDGRILGSFHGLDNDGALLIELDDGELRRYTYGDVSLT